MKYKILFNMDYILTKLTFTQQFIKIPPHTNLNQVMIGAYYK